mmetsp:Transcript_1225/g.3443  ORF Transcript_1225/g.3443 Transcript_1225/m.3443 type:complete len:98 (+) Transcript_1225:1735-2028(+)
MGCLERADDLAQKCFRDRGSVRSVQKQLGTILSNFSLPQTQSPVKSVGNSLKLRESSLGLCSTAACCNHRAADEGLCSMIVTHRMFLRKSLAHFTVR